MRHDQQGIISAHRDSDDVPLLDDARSADSAGSHDENLCLRDHEFSQHIRRGDDCLHRSVRVPDAREGFWTQLRAYLGPGMLVAVGYMDPGNWATDLAAGSAYNYKLLFLVMTSNLIAIFLQTLALRLGIAGQVDLAQACRENFWRPVSLAMWILAEIAIVACDLAEVIGSAIALKLLVGLPMVWGVACTSADVLLLLALGGKDMRVMEILVVALTSVIAMCFAVEIYLAKPDAWKVLQGTFIPPVELLTDQKMALIAVGILGATVMPHNLYLHSSVVQSRDIPRGRQAVAQSIRMATLDSNIALSLACFVNGAILILAAATFFRSGNTDVTTIDQAYFMLARMLGKQMASYLFAVALLASGQQSTLTGTLAGIDAIHTRTH